MANGRPDRVPVGPFGMERVSGEMAAELIAKTDPFISVGLGGNAFMGQLVKTESVREGNDTITTIFTPKGSLTQRHRRTDITGYTAYLSESELEHAEDSLRSLLELLIEHAKLPQVISRLEGDAVISYASEGSFLQGHLLILSLPI